MSPIQNNMETNSNNSLQPTSVSVLMINSQGMMLSVLGQDYFVSYNRVPWLRDARVSSALNVRMCGQNAIEWPELDVDLEIESLKHPERYPLVMKRSPLDVIRGIRNPAHPRTPAQVENVRLELKQLLEIITNRDAEGMKKYLTKIRGR